MTEEMLAIAVETRSHILLSGTGKASEVTTERRLDVAGQREKCAMPANVWQMPGFCLSTPMKDQIKAAAEVGAPFIEIHTGC